MEEILNFFHIISFMCLLASIIDKNGSNNGMQFICIIFLSCV